MVASVTYPTRLRARIVIPRPSFFDIVYTAAQATPAGFFPWMARLSASPIIFKVSTAKGS